MSLPLLGGGSGGGRGTGSSGTGGGSATARSATVMGAFGPVSVNTSTTQRDADAAGAAINSR